MTVVVIPVYDYDPAADFPRYNGCVGDVFTYVGPATSETTITITDNGAGHHGLSLEDGSEGETATGTITINGNTSTDVSIENEIGWTLRDTITNEIIDVAILFVKGGDAYGSYQIASAPLTPGRDYEITRYSSGPDDDTADSPVFLYSNFLCFAKGSLIATPSGERPVQELREGDLVLTLDNGPQELCWIGHRRTQFEEDDRAGKPVQIKKDSFGPGLPHSHLILSPQHKILHATMDKAARGKRTEWFSISKAFLNATGVRQMLGRRSVEYYSLMTPQHEVLFANGLGAESYYPGPYGLSLLSWIDRAKITSIFPGVAHDPLSVFGPPARPVVKKREAWKITTPVGIGRSRLRNFEPHRFEFG